MFPAETPPTCPDLGFLALLADHLEGVVPCADEAVAKVRHRAVIFILFRFQSIRPVCLVELRQFDVGGLTPGEFVQNIRADVEERSAKLVVIDSFTGYLNLMPHHGELVAKLHELLRFLSGRGVLTLLTANLHGVLEARGTDIDTSYLADTVVFMRHFEAMGAMRYCMAVLKKRHGEHERTIREIEFVPGGFRVGPPLKDFTGVLSGTPEYVGDGEALLERDGDDQRE